MSKDGEEQIIKEIERDISQGPPESKASILDCLDCNRQSPQKYYVTPSVYAEWLRYAARLREKRLKELGDIK